MLTIRTPMTFRCLRPICETGESFYERICSGYEILSVEFTPEELLHMVTQPPDIYMESSGFSQIIYDSNVRNVQITKWNMVNSLLNRILLYHTENFTYRDTVFIQTMLNKLGISDVNIFMKQVSRLQEDTRNVNEMVSVCWNHFQTLKRVVEDAADPTEKEKEKSPPEDPGRETLYFLHDKIFQRLQSGAVYEEMRAFTVEPQGAGSRISAGELGMAEQGRTAVHILLNKLQNEIYQEHRPVQFYHVNRYEEGDITEESQTEQALLSELSSAVLLNIADNLYQIRYQAVVSGENNWYRTEHALFGAADQALQRWGQLHQSILHAGYNGLSSVRLVSEERRVELSILKELVLAAGRQFILESKMAEHRTEGTADAERTRMGRAIVRENLEQPPTWQTEEYFTNIQEDTEPGEADLRQDNEYYLQLKQHMDMFNEQNVHNRMRLQQAEQGTGAGEKIIVDRARAMRDSLRVLEDPGEVLLEYLEGTNELEERERLGQEQIISLMSRETREIYRILQEYRKNPESSQTVRKAGVAEAGQLSEKSAELLWENKQTELYHRSCETLMEETERTEKQWLGRYSMETPVQRQQTEAAVETSLVHRQMESTVREDILEKLEEQNRLLREKTTQSLIQEETEHVTAISNRHTERRIIENTETDLSELVREGVQRQLGCLSDRIYSRLEKRLVSERKRRGF